MRQLIVDCASPLRDMNRLRSDVAESDRAATTDTADTARWLEDALGSAVATMQNPSDLELQADIERFAREYCESLRFEAFGVPLGPCAEYLFLLSLVAVVRDALLLKEIAARGVDGVSTTVVTDRGRLEGFLGALKRVAGDDVALRAVKGQRYLDNVMGQYSGAWPGRALRLRAPRLQSPRKRLALATPGIAALLRGGGADARLAVLDAVEDASGLSAIGRSPRWYLGLDSALRAAALLKADACDTAVEWVSKRLSVPVAIAEDLVSDYLPRAVELSLVFAYMSVAAHVGMTGSPRLRAVAVWNDVLPQHRALVDLAGTRGVSTVLYQHGVFGLRTMHDMPRTSVVAAWGESGREWLEMIGLEQDRIRVVGGPYLAQGAYHHEPSTPPRILYAAQTSSGFMVASELAGSQRMLSEIASVCLAAGWQLVTKPHPAEAYPEWGEGIHGIHPEVEVHIDVPIGHLLNGCDVMVSRSSTCVIEALVAGVPVVVVVPPVLTTGNPYVGADGVVFVSQNERLREGIELALSRRGMDFSPAVEWLAGPSDGSVGRRLMDVLEELEAR